MLDQEMSDWAEIRTMEADSESPVNGPHGDDLYGVDAYQFVYNKYQLAKNSRDVSERHWLYAYEAWRGEYSLEEQKSLQEMRERVAGSADIFVKITKTKVQAAHGQLLDVLFSSTKFPIGVEPSIKDGGTPEVVHITNDEGEDESESPPEPEMLDVLSESYGFPGDGKELAPGTDTKTLLGGAYTRLKELLGNKKIKDGRSPDKMASPEVYAAKESAERLEKEIHKQLEATNARRVLQKAVHQCALYGTGIVKGPFTYTEEVPEWITDDTGRRTYAPSFRTMPKIEYVSIWDFYPDPHARDITEAEFVIQRHRMNRNQVRRLQEVPGFNAQELANLMAFVPTAPEKEEHDDALTDNHYEYGSEQYEILEYWGYVDTETAQLMGLEFTESDIVMNSVMVNIWVSEGYTLRLVVNPFEPVRLPYHVFCYEESLDQIWGIGVAENMEDTQRIMNTHMRMAIDNLRFSGNVMLEVSQQNLAPNQDMILYPGKVFRKRTNVVGQTIYPITVPNVAPSHIQMFDKARQIADEQTGIPSYSHGQTGISGMSRTASGMSMLMGASALNIKTIIKNIDLQLLEPLGRTFHYWNMQFNDELTDIVNDIRIVSRGTTSLMQREVKTQRILQFLSLLANPQLAPFINVQYYVEELAKSMDLDPDKGVNDATTAKLYAEILQAQQNLGGPNNGQGVPQTNPTGQASQNPTGESPQGGTGGPAGIPAPSDTSGVGGGNIGIGDPSQAG